MIGIVLAGGAASRLGGIDKGLRVVDGVPMIERVVAALRTQCRHLVVNTNGDAARLAFLGVPTIADDLPDRPGPLAGILAGLDWLSVAHPGEPAALTVPTDTPFLPGDLVARLAGARQEGSIACAASGGRVHHTIAIWPVALRHDLRHALVEEGLRKVGLFLTRHRAIAVEWAAEPVDPFFNANTPADLQEAARLARHRAP